MNNGETIRIADFYYAVMEGEDDEGNPIYGEPKKLYENEEEN